MSVTVEFEDGQTQQFRGKGYIKDVRTPSQAGNLRSSLIRWVEVLLKPEKEDT